MFKSLQSRLILILLMIGTAIYVVSPTYQKYFNNNYYNLTKVKKEQVDSKAIKLGLDLQGGMYVLLELDEKTLVEKLATTLSDELKSIIQEANQNSIKLNIDFFDSFEDVTQKNDFRLSKYYVELRKQSKAQNSDNSTIIKILKDNRTQGINSVIEILRNRIDEFGVSEPTIIQLGSNRIIVELAGVEDSDRARKLIQRTASLELSLVQDERLSNVLTIIDEHLIKEKIILPSNESTYNEILATNNVKDILLGDTDDPDIGMPLTANNFPAPEDVDKYPFSSYLTSVPEGTGVLLPYIPKVQEMINIMINTEKLRGGRFVWGNKLIDISISETELIKYKPLYYISDRPAVVGGMIQNPSAMISPPGSQNAGQWVISLDMNKKGTRKWSTFTGSNIGKRVAIVLDEKVYMAPYINDKIPTGQTLISGLDDAQEAQDIANVLSAGELPAPVSIIEERTVGPSLGRDSIKSGSMSLVIAFITILIFILFYYKISGIIANVAMILNILFILSLLTALGATLTLPGIAGLILTIGISIDANVIIFERIKEELDIGKSTLSAINAGYKRAFITILDADITTLIAAFVLANIGSGPIKGFAITLSIGIICSMFTAIFVTKTLYMVLMKKNREKLSI